MTLGETVLHKRAKKLELKGSLKIKFNPTCLLALDELLHDIYVVSRPRPDDYHLRGDLVRVFNVMAKEVYGSSNDFPVVEAFGSFLMDMFSDKSDLDLSVNFSNESVEFPRAEKIKALRKFAKKLYRLQSRGHVFGVNPIMSAKVPILKVVDSGTKIECDISVENKDGILKSQFVLIISEIDERFQKLSSLMKAWAKAYNINSSKDRTLNSLSIILFVAFHLQTRDPPILPPFSALVKDGTNPADVRKAVQDHLHYGQKNKESLGELFATLLSKLASVETLWPEGLCVSTYEGSWTSKTWGSKVGNISVEDFTDRSQNVARSVGMAGVKMIYKCIHSSLHHLSAFVDGQIQAPKLKEVLFGAQPISPLDENATMNLKRSFPVHDSAAPTPIDPVVTKKARPTNGWLSWEAVDQATDGWRSWGAVDQATDCWRSWGEVDKAKDGWRSYLPPISSTPFNPPQEPQFVAPRFGHGSKQVWTRFEEPQGSLQLPFPPPNYDGLQGPLGFNGPHGPPGPMFPMPNDGGQWNSEPIYNQIPGQGALFNPYGHR